MSSMRIVLVDPLGDVLFSGESWLASGPAEAPATPQANAAPPDEDDEDDDCPQTLRSGESGIFPVERAKPATNANDAHPTTPETKRDERAA
jgi:hypothetical protein